MRRAALVLTALVALASAVAVAQAQQSAPTAATGAATSVQQHSAVLNGTVRPNGANTSWYFEFGPTTAYGRRTSPRTVNAGQGKRSVSRSISGLLSGTQYHYRIVATNSGGTATGADRTFTTTGPTQVAPAVSLAANPNPVRFGRSTKLTGQVTGPGNSGAVVTLQAKPFPYTGPFTQVGNSVVATSTGTFTFTDSPQLHTQYRAVSRRGGGVLISPIVLERVRISVSTQISDSTPRAGRRVRFHGSAKPAHRGATVRIQRRTGSGRYVTIARGHLRFATSTRSSYSLHARIRTTGYYRVRVSTPHGDHSSGIGTRRRLRVH